MWELFCKLFLQKNHFLSILNMKLLLNSQLQHHLTTKVVKESKGHLKPFMPRSYTQQKIKLIRDNFVFSFSPGFRFAWFLLGCPWLSSRHQSDCLSPTLTSSPRDSKCLPPFYILCQFPCQDLSYFIQFSQLTSSTHWKMLPHYHFFLCVGNIHIPFKAVIFSISRNFYQLQHSQP